MTKLVLCSRCGKLWQPKGWQIKYGHARFCADCKQPDPHWSKEYRSGRAARLLLAGGRCEFCGKQPAKKSLECHHVNGDSSDNRLENLQMLCRRCHVLTMKTHQRARRRAAKQPAPPKPGPMRLL